MTDAKPIIFSGPMVRAILAGRKWQTRRVLKPQPVAVTMVGVRWPDGVLTTHADNKGRLPYLPGDLLWVRETWCNDIGSPSEVSYRATAEEDSWQPDEVAAHRWRASIHMPRWASRIMLRVTEVRVQRVQDISERDAEAEGVKPVLVPPDGGSCPHVEGFAAFWNTLHAERPGCSWDDDPWVAAISFERIIQ
jgi:hypothetical protein